MTSMLDENGATQSSEQDILDVFAAFYEKLFKAKAKHDDVNDDDIAHASDNQSRRLFQKKLGSNCNNSKTTRRQMRRESSPKC